MTRAAYRPPTWNAGRRRAQATHERAHLFTAVLHFRVRYTRGLYPRAPRRGAREHKGDTAAGASLRREGLREVGYGSRVPVLDAHVRALEELEGVLDPLIVQLLAEGLGPEVEVPLV